MAVTQQLQARPALRATWLTLKLAKLALHEPEFSSYPMDLGTHSLCMRTPAVHKAMGIVHSPDKEEDGPDESDARTRRRVRCLLDRCPCQPDCQAPSRLNRSGIASGRVTSTGTPTPGETQREQSPRRANLEDGAPEPAKRSVANTKRPTRGPPRKSASQCVSAGMARSSRAVLGLRMQ
jgi:hypothetical protein